MKKRIAESAYSSPIFTAVAAALFAVAAFSVSNVADFGETAKFIIDIVSRALVVIFTAYAVKACSFKAFAKPEIGVLRGLLIFLGLLVSINNFPIIGFITGNVALKENPRIVRYIAYCIAIGVAEEYVFRGFIMPVVGLKFRNKPHAPFITVLVTSAIFALCHLFNVFSAGIPATLLQVGYTFLTGGLFCAAYLFTENLVFPIVLHVIFDLGGLMFDLPFGIAAGNMWDTATIIITAVLGVIVTAVYAFAIWNYKPRLKE
ncbi:MAG: CPBP family intramembrane glutamic endopeptidase [Christensenellaceae bacterium]